jgi:hypothetical protein
MLCCEETGEFDRAIAVGEELASFFHDDREFSKRLLALYIKTSRYDEASELLTGLNGSKDIETMAAAVYLSTLKKDWEKMLTCFVGLHTSIFPGIELSLERIVRLEEALIQKGEHRAARHIQKSIAAFIENSPF